LEKKVEKMLDNGWISLHRVLLEWEWYKTPHMVHFWVHCLLRANHKTMKWQGQEVLEGQFISGRKQLAFETGLSEQTIRTLIDKLKSTNELTSKTTSKYSVFTINSWKKYQTEKRSTSKLTNDQPAINQQLTTNNNVNNVNNEKNTLCIFDFWTSFDVLIKHKTLDQIAEKAIEKQLNEYSIQDLTDSIKNYAEVIANPEDYYFKHKFQIGAFFRTGSMQKPSPFKNFLNESEPLTNFKNNQPKKASLAWNA
jgi:hypothetical protein